jgi:hypothetical protein
MNSHLRRRQSKDQPSAADINRLEAQYIADKCPVRFRIVAVQEKMHPVYHGFSLTTEAVASLQLAEKLDLTYELLACEGKALGTAVA